MHTFILLFTRRKMVLWNDLRCLQCLDFKLAPLVIAIGLWYTFICRSSFILIWGQPIIFATQVMILRWVINRSECLDWVFSIFLVVLFLLFWTWSLLKWTWSIFKTSYLKRGFTYNLVFCELRNFRIISKFIFPGNLSALVLTWLELYFFRDCLFLFPTGHHLGAIHLVSFEKALHC